MRAFDFKYDGLGAGTMAFNNLSGIGKGGTGTLKVDGTLVDTKRMEKTIPIILQWDESFDIGSDTITGIRERGSAQVAIGEYNRKIDARIAEIKQTCGLK